MNATSSKLLLLASVWVACLSCASRTSYFVASGLGQYDHTGRYDPTGHVCDGHPVYQRVSDTPSDRYALFDVGLWWIIGAPERATTCQNSGWLESVGEGCIDFSMST